MLNKKGVSLISVVITIIVIVIIASIAVNNGYENIVKAHKSAFMTDLESLILSLEKYNTRAVGYADPMTYYEEDFLQWDGESERAENTAKLEDGINEDTVRYIFDNNISENVKGKIKIINGKLYVDREYETEFQWATEQYKYMTEEF